MDGFMASITRNNGKYHVRVRIKGYPAKCNSFFLKSDAQTWGRDTERSIKLGLHTERDSSFGDLLQRYSEEVSVHKKTRTNERFLIAKLIRSWIAAVPVSKLSAQHFARYRDQRLRSVSPSTCIKDLAVMGHCLKVAGREWGYSLQTNPVSQIRKPSPNKPRTRRLSFGEEESIFKVIGPH
jgi:hypothetical protein